MSTFDIGKSINSTAEWLTSSPLIYTLTSNTIYMTLLLTIAMIFIISYINESHRYRYAKLAIYLFFANSILLFVHHIALTKRIEKSFKGEETEKIVGALEPTEFNDSTIKPKIFTGGDEDAEEEEPDKPPQVNLPETPEELNSKIISEVLNSNDEVVKTYEGNLPKVIKI
jgi:hypothetical protein